MAKTVTSRGVTISLLVIEIDNEQRVASLKASVDVDYGDFRRQETIQLLPELTPTQVTQVQTLLDKATAKVAAVYA